MQTLNQFTEAVRNWSKKHPLINDFGTGPYSLIGQSESMKFPYMWFNFTNNHTININNNITPIPSFQFIFMDKTNKNVNPNRDNNGLETSDGMEVKSDTYRLLLDFVYWLSNQPIKMEENIQVQSIIDETKETSSGWMATINIKFIHMKCSEITNG